MENVVTLDKVGLIDRERVGGKNASLGELMQCLSGNGIRIPEGYATTVSAFKDFLSYQNLDQKIYKLLNELNIEDVDQLHAASQTIRLWIREQPFQSDFIEDISDVYEELNRKEHSVAVRSSATYEDLNDSSFAGQQESYLNIKGFENVLQAIKEVYASVFTERAIAYRAHQGFQHEKVGISAGIQRMVRSDLGSSGVIFTLDTESGFDHVIFITAAYGLGESIVQGALNPDEYYVHKPTLVAGRQAIIRRILGTKAVKSVYKDEPHQIEALETVKVAETEQLKFCLSDQEIHHLAQQALHIENHYQTPMDIEWAKDGLEDQIYIVQARPETVKSQSNLQAIERFQLLEKGKVKTKGRSIGDRIGKGTARLIMDPKNMKEMQDGEILITDMTDPDWEPIMKRANAIVTNRGGRTCHAAIIARELGIPAVVGCNDASEKIQNGEQLTISCAEGETGYVYSGLLKHKVEKIRFEKLPPLPFKMCMNLGNPEKAFAYRFIPNDGVGLARLEFIISNMIGVHPKALLEFDSLQPDLKQEINRKTAAYLSPVEFYIEKLAEGIATIAAAFHPKPIIVRFSDFKSNEYANLLGGHLYEPKEENPMLGYRGASRYLSDQFRACFELECKAIRRVRDEKGLNNTQVMIPFVRTVKEASDVIELLKKFGLKRSSDLHIYMMCEIPSNVILAEEFLEYFDGYSIGSNDLTQLTLGLDRDSGLIAHLFDERNAAIKQLLSQVISVCQKLNKYIGICGQGPSDHPDFARWLMKEGISSMSLSADSIISTWLYLAGKTP